MFDEEKENGYQSDETVEDIKEENSSYNNNQESANDTTADNQDSTDNSGESKDKSDYNERKTYYDGAYYNNSNYNGSNYSNSNYTGSNYNNANNGANNNGDQKNKKSGAVIAAIAVSLLILIVGISLLSETILDSFDRDVLDIENQTRKAEEVQDIGSTEVQSDNAGTSIETGKVILTDVSAVVDDVMPAIVAITSTTLVESNYYDDFSWFFGYDNNQGQGYEEQGAGSGIIIEQTDTELLIVTNNHVVEGADSLTVQFVDGESVDASIKGTDTDTDIAIVAIPLENIKSETLAQIKKATLGNSDEVTVGEGVIAIGNALGYGQSVTTGVISAKDREVTFDNENTMSLLQTDAAINGGNSGGALINSKGEVIGINVAKYSSSGTSYSSSVEGMGFAIPISSVTDKIDELENRETRAKVSDEERGYLGIQGYKVTSDAAEQYSMPYGVFVYSVSEGSGAEKAGIVSSDVIVKFEGQTITTMEELQDALQYYKAGEEVTVTIAYRDGRDYTEKDVKVKLSSYSDVSNSEEETTSRR